MYFTNFHGKPVNSYFILQSGGPTDTAVFDNMAKKLLKSGAAVEK